MRYALVIACLMSIVINTVLLAANHTDNQQIVLNVPKVALVSVNPTIPFQFTNGANTATGTSQLAISSNDPQAKLYITPSGVQLSVTSNSIQCPSGFSSNTLSCHVGVQRVTNGSLTFDAIRLQDEMNITYTLTD